MPPQTLSAYYTDVDGTPSELRAREEDDDALNALTSDDVNGSHTTLALEIEELDRLVSRPRYDFWRARPATRRSPLLELRCARGTRREFNEPRRFPWQIGEPLRLFDRHTHALVLRGAVAELGFDGEVVVRLDA